MYIYTVRYGNLKKDPNADTLQRILQYIHSIEQEYLITTNCQYVHYIEQEYLRGKGKCRLRCLATFIECRTGESIV